MALLTATQGTPYRVKSVIEFLSANDGTLARDELAALLSPTFTVDGAEQSQSGVAVSQTMDAAAGLGLVRRDKLQVSLESDLPERLLSEFSDYVFDKLCSAEPTNADSVIFEALALVLVRTDKERVVDWSTLINSKTLVDFLRDNLGAGSDPGTSDRFNNTKLTYWRRWLHFLGLWREANLLDYPEISRRLGREITRLNWKGRSEIDAKEFVAELGQIVPFIDGGTLFEKACSQLGYQVGSGQLSICLSAALRILHESGLIALKVRGDASGGLRLADDQYSKIRTFHTVKLAFLGDGNE